MMTPEDSSYCLMYAQEAYSSMTTAVSEWASPHVRLRPKISQDGNRWCMLYGDNIQDGVVGFGDTPVKAAIDFDEQWWHARCPGSGGE